MNKVIVFLKGLLMWACDVVPWVSWGTIAFITWIYEQLIDAIHAFDVQALKLLFTWKRVTLWQKINGWFLFPLILGILTAIISFAKLIDYLLVAYPTQLRAIFAGLLIASVIIVSRHLKQRNRTLCIRAILGILIGYVFTSLPLLQAEPTLISTFFAAAVAIMAMILPWISGSYLLLMLNHYQYIIQTLVDLIDGMKDVLLIAGSGDISLARTHMQTLPRATVFVFIAGAVCGILLFVRLLHWLKANYHDQLIAVLTGIMVWALHKVRPWKEAVETYVDRHGDVKTLLEAKILPPTVSDALLGLALAVLWFLVVMGIEKISQKNK